MILFMKNAKSSFGLDVWETETDFSPMKAATPHALGFTVTTKFALIYTVADKHMC